MKRILALVLAASMVLCLCSCTGDVNDSSSDSVEVEVQQVIVDQTSGDDTTAKPSDDNNAAEGNSSTQTPNVSGDTSSASSIIPPIQKYQNMYVEVDICDDVVRGYLDADDARNQFYWLNTYSSNKCGMNYDHQKLYLDWYSDGSLEYTVTFSEKQDFSNAFIVKSRYNDIENANLVPGKTYYYKVTGTISSDILGSGQVKVKDIPARWIGIDGVGNVRDMGGWKAQGGKTVKYEMIYRGQKLENVTQDGLNTIKSLGFKTELDIRYKSQMYQTPGTGMNYEFIESPGQYDTVINSKGEIGETFKASYKRVFELLADESNYPFYAHCNAGADRTGTFAFIVSGVLGVSYEDLTRDFELTSFSSTGARWRGKGLGNSFGPGDDVMQEDSSNTVAWGRLYKTMMQYGEENNCTTLQESIEHWLINYIGVKQSQIDSFKNIMLE